jgi:hypothetical protein
MSVEYVTREEALELFTQGLEYLESNRQNPDYPKEGKIVEDDLLKITLVEKANPRRSCRTSPTPTGCRASTCTPSCMKS